MKRKAYYAGKLKRATHMLFFKRHRKPGVKGWELRKRLGSDYPKVLALLDRYLERLDLHVNTVLESDTSSEKPSLAELDKARFYVTLRGGLSPRETKMMGWRIDDIAGLAMTIATIISRKGRVPRDEVEQLLRDKLPGWRVNVNVDRYIRAGYVDEDDKGQLYLDWRTRAEIDDKTLVDLLLMK